MKLWSQNIAVYEYPLTLSSKSYLPYAKDS
jgi:hypothetical protein